MAEEFLTNPPLQHFRLRDALINFSSDGLNFPQNWQLREIFTLDLLELRMDGNLSGLAWFGRFYNDRGGHRPFPRCFPSFS